MDNPVKQTTQGTQYEEKQNKNTTQYELYTTIRKQTQILPEKCNVLLNKIEFGLGTNKLLVDLKEYPVDCI